MRVHKYVIKESLDPESVDNIKDSIGRHEGINAIRVDLLANTLTVDYDGGRYSEKDIRDFISNAGLNVKSIKSDEELY